MATINGLSNTPLNTSLIEPDDATDIDASDVSDPDQKLLDNTLRLAKFKVDVPGDLSALTGLVNGERVFVAGHGLYTYDAASSEPVKSPWTINGPSGVGRFFSQYWDIANEQPTGGRLATTGSDGVLASPSPNHTIEKRSINVTTTSDNFTSTSWANVANRSLAAFTKTLGSFEDLNHRIEAHGSVTVDVPSSTIVDLRLVIDINGSIYEVDGTQTRISSEGTFRVPFCFHVQPPAIGGPISVRLQAKLVSNVSVSFGRSNLIAEIIAYKVGT